MGFTKSVGTVSIRVLSDTTTFESELKEKLQKIENTVRLSLRAFFDGRGMDEEARSAAAQAQAILDASTAELPVSVENISAAEAARVKAEAEALAKAATIHIPVSADNAGVKEVFAETDQFAEAHSKKMDNLRKKAIEDDELADKRRDVLREKSRTADEAAAFAKERAAKASELAEQDSSRSNVATAQRLQVAADKAATNAKRAQDDVLAHQQRTEAASVAAQQRIEKAQQQEASRLATQSATKDKEASKEEARNAAQVANFGKRLQRALDAAKAEEEAAAKALAAEEKRNRAPVNPLDSGFKTNSDRELDKLSRKVELDATVNGTRVEPELRALIEAAKANLKLPIPVEADGIAKWRAEVEASLSAVRAAVKSDPVEIPTRMEGINALYKAKIAAQVATTMKGIVGKVPVTLEGEKILAEAARLDAELKVLLHASIPVDVHEAVAFKAKLAGMVAEIDALHASVGGGGGGGGADGGMGAMAGGLGKVSAALGVVKAIGTGAFDFLKTFAVAPVKIGATTAAITAAIGSVLSLASSFNKVYGILALIPAIAASAGAVIGTTAMALSGVMNALSAGNKLRNPDKVVDPRVAAMDKIKAQESLSDALYESSQSQIMSNRKVQDSELALRNTRISVTQDTIMSQRAVADAEKELARANTQSTITQRNLTAARIDAARSLRDIGNSLTDSTIAQKQAAIDLVSAGDLYKQAMADPGRSSTTREKLNLDLQRATQTYKEQTEKVQDLTYDQGLAAKKGVEGSNSVISAKQAEIDMTDRISNAERSLSDARAAQSQQAITGARAIFESERSLSDARIESDRAQVTSARQVRDAHFAILKNMIDLQQPAKEFADYMAKLSPSARELVTDLLDIKDAFKPVVAIAQENLFKGLGDSLKDVVNTLLPSLKSGIGNVGTALNGGWKSFFDSLKTGLGGGALDRIFSNITTGIIEGNKAIAPFVHAFVVLTDVGSKYLPIMGTWFTKIADQFDAFISKAAGNGDLEKWINGGIQALKDIGGIIKGVIDLFGGLAGAATEAGGPTLGSFSDGLKKIADIVSKEPMHTALVNIFRGAFTAMQGAGKGIGGLVDGLVKASPTIEKIFGIIGKILEVVGDNLGKLVSDPKFQKGLTDLFEGILGLVTGIAPSIPALAQGFGAFLTIIGKIDKEFGPVLATLFEKLGPIIDTVAQALGPLIEVLGPLLVQAFKEAAPKVQFIVDVISAIMPIVVDIVKGITALSKGDLQGAMDAFGKVFGDVWDGIKKIWGEALPKLWQGILDSMGDLDPKVKKAGTAIIKAMADGMKEAFHFVEDSIRGALALIGINIPNSPAKAGPLSGDGWYRIGRGGQAVVKTFAGGIDSARGSIKTAITGAMGDVSPESFGITSSLARPNYSSSFSAAIGKAQSTNGKAPTTVEKHVHLHELANVKSNVDEAMRQFMTGASS